MKEKITNQIFIITGLPESGKTKVSQYFANGWEIPVFDGKYTPTDIIKTISETDKGFILVDPRFMDPKILKGALDILKAKFKNHRYHFFWSDSTFEESLAGIQKNPKSYDHSRFNLLNQLRNFKPTDHRNNNISFAVLPAKECREAPNA